MSDSVSTDPAAAATDAPTPARFRLRSWRRALMRAFATMGREQLTLVAAGCAFYALLALAPSFAAIAALYGLFSDPAEIAAHLEALRDVAPPAAFDVIADQAGKLQDAGRRTLGWASLGAVLFAIWSARAGVRALMAGVSLAYRERDGRHFLVSLAVTYLLTGVLVAIATVALVVVVIAPALLSVLPLGETARAAGAALRWPVALLAMLAGLGVLYRYGPHRRNARPGWVTPGALAAIVIWLAGSFALSAYLARFASYNETYGALGAVAALLMWFWLSAVAALFGAVLNAELELETAADTTSGEPRPLGRRGAYVADHVAVE